MKRAIPLLLLLAVAAYGATMAYAQGYNTGYTHKTTSVTSGTAPVTVLSPAFMQTWCITADAACTKGLLIFAYPGTLPGTAPANTDFIAPGATRCDAVTNDQNVGHDAIGEAWGAVFASGGATCNAYSTYR